MTESPKYETNEASEVFRRAAARQRPHEFAADIEAAAIGLLEAVTHAAKAAGYSVVPDLHGGVAIGAHGYGAATLGIESPGGVWMRPQQRPGQFATLEIEYDPRSRQFVGKEFDAAYEPAPDTPRRRRNAVAVLAEAVVKILDQNKQQ